MTKIDLADLINPNDKDKEEKTDTTDLLKLIAVENLLSQDNLKSNSRLKSDQISHLTKLYLFAEIFEIDFMKSLADNILNLQISINGLGRKELVDLVGKVYNPFEELERQQKSSRKEIFR